MPTSFTFHSSLFISEALVRLTGLEPAHREILDPKSSASTNSATGAFLTLAGAKVILFTEFSKLFSQNFSCFLNDEVDALRCSFVCQGYIDVRIDAEFRMLLVAVVHGTSRETDAPSVG